MRFQLLEDLNLMIRLAWKQEASTRPPGESAVRGNRIFLNSYK